MVLVIRYSVGRFGISLLHSYLDMFSCSVADGRGDVTTCQEVKDDDVIPVTSGQLCVGTSDRGSWLLVDQDAQGGWKFPSCHLHSVWFFCHTKSLAYPKY